MLRLPDRNGYEFIAEARQRCPNLTAIAVSAYFTAADQDRGHEAGFDMYFAKPVDLLDLQVVVVPDRRGIAVLQRLL